MKYRFILILILAIALYAFSGCSANEKKTIKIGVVDWPEAVCMTELVKTILEREMNYQVEIAMLDIDSLFSALSEGRCDFFLDAWLPITHDKFIYKYGNKIENIGINYKGARTGLVVPEYVSINSIAQLNECKNKFNGRIVGIEKDAGIIKSTEKAIAAYNLEYELTVSNSTEMTDRLKNALANKEWIVVTGWSPHWKFSHWNLKFLEDPYFIYGGEENLHTVARKGFSKDHPQAAAFLEKFFLYKRQMLDLLLIPTDERENYYTNWIDENRELVDEWVSTEP